MEAMSKAIEPLDIFKSFVHLLEKGEECVAHSKKKNFVSQFEAALFNSKIALVEELINEDSEVFKKLEESLKKSEEYIDPEKSREFALQVQLTLVNSRINLIETLSEEVKAHSIEGWENLAKKWDTLRENAEILKRRIELFHPANKQSFKATLRWMAEYGIEEDFELLQRIKNNPPYSSKDVCQLLIKTDRQISDKVYDPNYVLRKGEEAYQRNKQAWDQQYAGQYIAIHRGQVVDADRDKPKLIERLMAAQKEQGPFRAYIVKVGTPTLAFRGPRRRLRVR